MKKESREARNKYSEENINLLKPLDLTAIGTANDPCFGKYNDPQADECKVCGDFEICAIIQSQMNHNMRAAWEKDHPTKVINEPVTKNESPPKPSKKAYIKLKKSKNWSDTGIKKGLIKKFKISETLANKLLKKYG